MEPFAIKIRLDSHIKGLQLPGTEHECKISQYADDTTCIVTTFQSIRKIFLISELYSFASGAVLNKDKSCAMWLGRWRDNQEQYGLKWVKSMKICGIFLGESDMTDINWNPIFSKMTKTANLYKARDLSIFGRASIANFSLCSKLWYVASTTKNEAKTASTVC